MTKTAPMIRWLVLLGLTPALASACMWIHGTTVDGHFGQISGRWSLQWLQRAMAETPKDAPSLFENYSYYPHDPVAAANDKAVQGLLKGNAEEAVKRLEEVEAKQPGAYFTAANLGTALELAGRDEEALRWILEGIKRNPDSHMETEWLHVNILKAKIQMKSQPEWLQSHTVTGLDLAQIGSDDYLVDSAQGQVNRWRAYESLHRQLRVRMLLVKPKDPIVAQMLTELAHLESHLGVQENAIEYLNMAEAYGADPQASAAFRAQMQELIRWRWLKPRSYAVLFNQTGFAGVLPVLLAVLLYVLFVLYRRRLQRERNASGAALGT